MDTVIYVTVAFRVNKDTDKINRQCREIVREAMDNYEIKNKNISYEEVSIPE